MPPAAFGSESIASPSLGRGSCSHFGLGGVSALRGRAADRDLGKEGADRNPPGSSQSLSRGRAGSGLLAVGALGPRGCGNSCTEDRKAGGSPPSRHPHPTLEGRPAPETKAPSRDGGPGADLSWNSWGSAPHSLRRALSRPPGAAGAQPPRRQ